jgi:hypothetical protein
MAVVTLRPNAIVSVPSEWTIGGGAASHNAAQSDNSDATYSIGTVGSDDPTGVLSLDFGTSALPSNSYVSKITPRVRLAYTSGNYFWISWALAVGSSQLPTASGILLDSSSGGIQTVTGNPDTLNHLGSAFTQADIDAIRLNMQAFPAGSPTSGRVYESYIDVEYNLAPVVTITAPSEGGTITTTTRPVVTWTFTDTENDPQESYQVKVFSGAGAVSNPETEVARLVEDSGRVYSIAQTYTLATNLGNGVYQVYVRISDAGSAGRWSDWTLAAANNSWTQNVTFPGAPTITATVDSTTKRVRLDVTAATSGHTILVEYADAGSWHTLRNGAALAIDAANKTIVWDDEAPLNFKRRYRARAYTGSGTSLIVGSASSEVTATVTHTGWWLMDPANALYAIDLDGTNDYVVTSDVLDFSGTSPFTFEIWVRVDTLSGAMRILSKDVAADGYKWTINTDGSVTFARRISSSDQAQSTAAGVVTAGNWIHLAVRYDGTNIRQSVMAVASGSASASAGSLPGNSASLTFGSASTPGTYFNGRMKEARFWNYYRTDQELLGNLFTTMQGNEKGLVGYWPMNEGSGTIAYDYSGAAAHGTLTNGPLWSRDVPGLNGMQVEVPGPSLAMTRPEQQASYSPLGRMTKITVRDTVQGEEFDLRFQFYSLEEYEAFNKIRAGQRVVLLKAYTGQQWWISFGQDRRVEAFMNYEPPVYDVTIHAVEEAAP